MLEVDPLKKAAECRLALSGATDPVQRALLSRLRDLWLDLSGEAPLPTPELTQLVEAVARLHRDVFDRDWQGGRVH